MTEIFLEGIRMNKLQQIVLATILFSVFVLPVPCRAADIYSENHKLFLIGEIRKGDAERFALAAAESDYFTRLTVNSPGGDLGEAMRIAALVKNLYLHTAVAGEGYCVSACFFILLESYSRTYHYGPEAGKLPEPRLRSREIGYVGIHRPYIKNNQGDFSAAQKEEDVMRNARSILVAKSVSQHLIDEMMARPSNEIYWLGKSDRNSLSEYAPGDEEALISKCGYKREGLLARDEVSDVELEKLFKCEWDYWANQYYLLQDKTILKLRKGWRPWSNKIS